MITIAINILIVCVNFILLISSAKMLKEVKELRASTKNMCKKMNKRLKKI